MARAPRHKSPPRPSIEGFRRASPGDIFWDLLTFDRLLTGPVIHIIYWAGLALIVLGGFGTIGAAVGVAMREEGLMKFALAIPVLVAGFLVLIAGALLWRSFCEFYVALFRISDDLRAMRAAMERGQSPAEFLTTPMPREPAQPAPPMGSAPQPEPQPELSLETPRPRRPRSDPTAI
jgi:hypothetical protein